MCAEVWAGALVTSWATRTYALFFFLDFSWTARQSHSNIGAFSIFLFQTRSVIPQTKQAEPWSSAIQRCRT